MIQSSGAFRALELVILLESEQGVVLIHVHGAFINNHSPFFCCCCIDGLDAPSGISFLQRVTTKLTYSAELKKLMVIFI